MSMPVSCTWQWPTRKPKLLWSLRTFHLSWFIYVICCSNLLEGCKNKKISKKIWQITTLKSKSYQKIDIQDFVLSVKLKRTHLTDEILNSYSTKWSRVWPGWNSYTKKLSEIIVLVYRQPLGHRNVMTLPRKLFYFWRHVFRRFPATFLFVGWKAGGLFNSKNQTNRACSYPGLSM